MVNLGMDFFYLIWTDILMLQTEIALQFDVTF